VCGTGVATLLGSAPAGAADGSQQITVTPTSGLENGQVVRVDGTDWPGPEYDFQAWFIAQCPSATFDFDRCGNAQPIPESEITATGSFSQDYAVRRSFRNFDDDATIDCGRECHVVAAMFVTSPSRPGHLEASAPISFRAPK